MNEVSLTPAAPCAVQFRQKYWWCLDLQQGHPSHRCRPSLPWLHSHSRFLLQGTPMENKPQNCFLLHHGPVKEGGSQDTSPSSLMNIQQGSRAAGLGTDQPKHLSQGLTST